MFAGFLAWNCNGGFPTGQHAKGGLYLKPASPPPTSLTSPTPPTSLTWSAQTLLMPRLTRPFPLRPIKSLQKVRNLHLCRYIYGKGCASAAFFPFLGKSDHFRPKFLPIRRLYSKSKTNSKQCLRFCIFPLSTCQPPMLTLPNARHHRS